MKKLFIVLGLALTGLTASAQDEESEGLPDGVLAVEWSYNPIKYDAKPFTLAEIKARLFLNAKSAVRLSVGFGWDSDKDENSITTPSEKSVSKTTTNNYATTVKAGLGYEYHFGNIGKLDLYGGVEGGYLGRFFSADKETLKTVTASSTAISTYEDNFEYKKRNADGDKQNETGFYGTLFAGFDFYVYKQLYIGAELGVTFNTGKQSGGNYTQVHNYRMNGLLHSSSIYTSETGTTVQDGVTTYGPIEENTTKYNRVNIEPAIRIGWLF
jgi:hypothetical protein